MPTVIDLFAGVGGLSLGATRAGFTLSAAVEKDEIALAFHRLNFPKAVHSDADISKLKGSDLLKTAELKKGNLDGLIGGPPCQGFSIIGRKEFSDSRNSLFNHFFRLVKETKPKFYLAENVLGIQNEKFSSIIDDALDLVREDYVILPTIKLKASDYGAPTIRTRLFFIGYQREFFDELTQEDFLPLAECPTTCVKDALAGLPREISPDWQLEEDGWQSFDEISNKNFFSERLSGHVPKDVGDKDSIERYKNKKEVSGCLGTRHSDDVIARFSALLPGKKDPIMRSVKLKADGFCPTLRAGTGSDKGRYQAVRPVHPDFPRVITPREGARLQGFPDWFVFHPTKWHSFRQIGNSVSPIVSEIVLKKIYEKLSMY